MLGASLSGFISEPYSSTHNSPIIYTSDLVIPATDSKYLVAELKTSEYKNKHDMHFGQPTFNAASVFRSIKTTRSTEQGGASVLNPNYGSVGLPLTVLEKCRKEFVKVASLELVEYGYGSASEQLLDRFFLQHKAHVGSIIQHIYLQEANNARVLIPLLKGVANFDYSDVYPHGQMMALAALNNVDSEVQEAGIRAYENWGNPNGLEALKAAQTPWDWLDSYRLATIEYLESFA